MVKIRGKERYKVSIPKKIKLRGIGKEIDRKEATLFDYMPPILGDKFRTNDILSRQLFREPPVDADSKGYILLGQKYLNKKQIIPALECYKFALDEVVGFNILISSLQENALLTLEEISHLRLGSPLETDLISKLSVNRKNEVNIGEYAEWLESLRSLEKQHRILNEGVYSLHPFTAWDRVKGAPFGYEKKTKKWVPIKNYAFSEDFKNCAKKYIDVCVSLGNFEEAIHFAGYFGAYFQRKIRSKKPKEILDIKWLKKYLDENHPGSSIGDSYY